MAKRPKKKCSVEWCPRDSRVRSMCKAHYERVRSGSDMDAPFQVYGGLCSIDGCSRKRIAKKMCRVHYQRKKRGHDMAKPIRKNAPPGSGSINAEGYRKVTAHGHPNSGPTGAILEHRLIMSNLIGRPLRSDEVVHHINGDRGDNRPENLELWSTSQPPGQRVEDKVAWAKSFLSLHGYDVTHVSWAA